MEADLSLKRPIETDTQIIPRSLVINGSEMANAFLTGALGDAVGAHDIWLPKTYQWPE